VHTLLAAGTALALIPMLFRALPVEPASAPPAAASVPLTETASEPSFLGSDGQRITPARLARFLTAHDSPLLPHVQRIVAAGVKHGVDPRWVVAIAGTETSFGRYHKGHNAWGWDAPNGLRRWGSWEEAIESYTWHFARGYRSREPGLIGARYAPFSPTWPETTRLFFSRI
jgi:hypothetical protein